MTNALFWLVPISSVLALLFAWYFYKQLMKTDEGTPQMKKIALYVRRGAMSYLRQQYKVVGLVFLVPFPGFLYYAAVLAASRSITG
mgnify:CR=1 FL=1